MAIIGSTTPLTIGSVGKVKKVEGSIDSPILGTAMAKVLRQATREEFIQWNRDNDEDIGPESEIPVPCWFYEVSLD